MTRRVTTARQQVEMLAPWARTAAGGTERPRMTTRDVIDQVRDQTGINLEMANTGGNCNVLEGRLEDGSWIRAADHEDFCHWDLEHRHDDESEHGPMGWDVSFHSNEHDEGGPWTNPSSGETTHFPPSDYWASGDTEPIHWHSDPDAHLHELPRVIGDAFASMPPDAKHKQQEGLREQLTKDGWKPGDEEWNRHFPGEGGAGDGGGREIPDYENLVNPKQDLGDEDFGHIFGSRRTAAFKWLPSGGGPSDDGGEEAHTETGHLVQTHHAYPPGYYGRTADPIGWGYSIWEYQDDMGDGYGPGYECVTEDENRAFPTHDGAKKAAEEHYYQLDHSKGKAPGSRIDYEGLVNPKDELDDDFGDIFGKQSMRRTAFDWKNEKWDGPAGEDFPDGYHRCKTENGHHLNVYRVRRPDGFAWSIYAPHRESDNPATMTMVDGAGHRYGEEMPSVEHAKAAAEEAYKKLYPIGTDTGPHDSGFDYDSFFKGNAPDDDDDFGDIFGRQSMRRVAFDWKPDDAAGGGERYRAALENGHVLAIQDHGGKYGWNWALFTNEESPEHGPIKQLVTGGGSHWEGTPGFYSAEHLPTIEHARAQAEQAYQELYPIGGDTGGGRDSGVDYSDLNRFMGEL